MTWRYYFFGDSISIFVAVLCVVNGTITSSYDPYTSAISQFQQTVSTTSSVGSSTSSVVSSTSFVVSSTSSMLSTPSPWLHISGRSVEPSDVSSSSSTLSLSPPVTAISASTTPSLTPYYNSVPINATMSSTYSTKTLQSNSIFSFHNTLFSSQLSDTLSNLPTLSTTSDVNSLPVSSSLILLSDISSGMSISHSKQLSISSHSIGLSAIITNTVLYISPSSMIPLQSTSTPMSMSVINMPGSTDLSSYPAFQTTQSMVYKPSVTTSQNISASSTTIASPSALNSTTKPPNSTTISSIAVPPTPGQQVMLQIPKLPAGVTIPTLSPNPCGASSCCTYGLNQLPALRVFDESQEAGSQLVAMRDVFNVTFSVQVRRPKELIPLLDGFFNITQSGNDHILMLQKKVDLEGLYKLAGEKMDVHEFQLQIACVDQLYTGFVVPPRLLNITIDDADDNMPVFIHTNDGTTDCEVPIYKAKTSEDFMGELNVNPQQIQAVDGDLMTRHNISYHVMHSEPNDYDVYFNVNEDSGVINKTKEMNSSDPNKYVIFIQAVEDSPQQKSRVAILSIVVVAPDPARLTSDVNPIARLSVQIACVFILMAFLCGVLVIVHHRYRLSHKKVHASYHHGNNARDVRLPKLAVYTSSNSSLNSAMPDVPQINSPSHVTLDDGPSKHWLELPPRESESQKKRRLIVTKPLDTSSRPSWNAPAPRPKRNTYNPFKPYQNARFK